MRRLIGYIIASITMLLAIVVSATPVLTNLNTGREFTYGRNYREIVFNVGEGDSNADNENRAQIIADEMTYRLKQYKVDDYSIKVQGNDKVAVSMNLKQSEFNYVAKYLTFSGESFALVSSSESNSSIKNEHKLFEPNDVRVEAKGQAKIPTIYIPLTKDGIADVKALLSEFSSGSSSGTTKSKMPAAKAEGEEEASTPSNYIYLWANLDETRGESIKTLESDPVAREKILLAFSGDGDSLWNPDSKEKETELIYMCASVKPDNPNELDTSGLRDQNDRANYLVNMLKAKKYSFEVTCPTATVSAGTSGQSSIDYFENARVLTPSAEKLVGLSTNKIIDYKSKTFIASMIAIAIVALLLVVFYRLSALAMVSTTLGTLFITFLVLNQIQVLFNIPALIGLIALAGGSLFGQIIYTNRLKEEIYKGRSIKKSNQEASKKANLLTVDASVIMAFSGLMLYALGDTALKPMGVVLFFGAVFALLMNLLVFKFLMYLLTNSTNLQDKYGAFNVDKAKVSNLMSTDEKVTYEGPYDKVDFTKRRKLFGSIFGILGVGALACIIYFGVTSPSKSPLNVGDAVRETNVCYVNLDVSTVDSNDRLINDEGTFIKYALKDTGLEEKATIGEDFELKEVSVFQYDETESKTITSYFISIQNFEIPENFSAEDLEATMLQNITDNLGYNENNSVSIRSSKEMIYTPNQGFVALATGIAIAGAALYIAFRFRPSRAIAFLITSAGSTMIAYGAMVGLHFIGTTALTSVAMPLVAITSMLASLFYLSTEKAMLSEAHQNLDDNSRKEIMVKALSRSAAPMFVFMLASIYVVINYFGFGIENSVLLFASALIGEVISVAAVLCILGPLSNAFGKAFGKIHLPKIKFFEKRRAEKVVKKTSEPEETIFIGIND